MRKIDLRNKYSSSGREPVEWESPEEWALEMRKRDWSPSWPVEQTRDLIEEIWFQYCKAAEPKDEKAPVAWFVKDFADGWIFFANEKEAIEEAISTGAVILVAYSHTHAGGNSHEEATEDRPSTQETTAD